MRRSILFLERLVNRRQMDRSEVEARIANQASRSERVARADFVIMNTGTLPELEEMVERAWEWIGQLEAKKATGPGPGGGLIPHPSLLASAHPLGTMPRCLRSVSSRTFNPPATSRPRSKPWRDGIERGDRFQTLLGITGSGKSATIAWTIEKVQRPTLVLAPNKSLAAQLAVSSAEFFPDNRVEYFVSYYDYYQPEAYLPSSDTYIEKDSSINDEIDRLRHSTTASLLTRRDVIVVASVSCIYGLGSPEEYRDQILVLSPGRDP